MTPASLKDRVLASTVRVPAADRGHARKLAAIGYGCAIAAMLTTFFAMGGVAHAQARPRAYTLGIALGATIIAVIATSVGVARGRSMLGRSPRVVALVAGLVPLATFVWMVAWNGHYAEPDERLGVRCFGLTVACASLLLAVMLGARARTIVHAPAIHGATIGAASGAWAGILVDLWCPLTAPAHVAVGHVLPLVVLLIAGALIGQAVLAIRGRSA